ncbi:Hypothetical protein NGAL_HAMBI1189_15150 [Neorhizobium galegae bv. officinalis]|uniref:Uncharacterized protein n=1 Tax=Neorhizobium galegae bv. officinalis TaxID=323656 RepID=A0A0T7GHH8_NEOGA|nr:Hypothetical protein NGAL_HAMBI1189_15150 [Neorhizobium galegae bv. officinalis]
MRKSPSSGFDVYGVFRRIICGNFRPEPDVTDLSLFACISAPATRTAELVIFETARLRLETWGENAVSELMKLHGSLDVVRFLDATGTFYDRPKAERRLAEWGREYHQHGIGKQRLVRSMIALFLDGRAILFSSQTLPRLDILCYPSIGAMDTRPKSPQACEIGWRRPRNGRGLSASPMLITWRPSGSSRELV